MKSNKHNIIYVILLILVIIIYYRVLKYYKKTTKLSNKYENRLINLINNKFNNTNNKLLIIPIFELGDSIIINGGIRYYSKIYKNIIYVCKKANYNFISYMYRDLDNIIYFTIPDKYILPYLIYYVPINNNLKKIFKSKNIAYINMHNGEYLMHFLERSYTKLNLDSDIAYNYFKIVRDYEREDKLYNKLINITGYKYIILVDDQKRNFLINKKYIENKKYPIFNVSINSKNKNNKLDLIKSDNLFDYIKIFENAQEIISIDTSIPWLIDIMNINVKTSIYGARPENIVYRNKNIKKLDIYLEEIIDTNINKNNYFFKNSFDNILSYII
jgi:hypothetical protein